MALTFELIQTLERFEGLQDTWNDLLRHNATNEIFLTYEWQHTWWQAYHPGELWVVVGRDEAGQLVGIAPWFMDLPERVIRPIGCVEVTDYLDVLVLPDQREAFCAGVVNCLAEHAVSFSRVNLCNQPGPSPTLEVLPRLLAERGFAVSIRQQEVCPVITLPETFEKYLESLEKKQRHEARRKLRRAGEGDDKVEWYVVGQGHDLQAEIERFIDLMAASHSEKAEFLADPQNTAFFRAIMPRVAACGWLQMAFLTVNGEPAAAYVNFDYDNRILVYNSGLMPAKFAAFSPGIVLLLRLVEHAIERGRSAFDFLRGNEEYKYRMGGRDKPVMEIQARLA